MVGGGVGDQRRQVDGLALQRAALVEAGQEQEVLDERAHAHGLVLDAGHGPGQGLLSAGRPGGTARRSPGWR